MRDDASRPDNRACPDGNAAADGGICADPDVFLQRNGCRGANAVAALLRVDGMTGAGKAYAGGNKGTCSDVYRRGIQNDTVIVDDRQAVGMDVEAIVTVEIRLNAGHGRAGAQQGAGCCAAFPVRWERCGCTPSTVALHGSVPPWGCFHSR